MSSCYGLYLYYSQTLLSSKTFAPLLSHVAEISGCILLHPWRDMRGREGLNRLATVGRSSIFRRVSTVIHMWCEG